MLDVWLVAHIYTFALDTHMNLKDRKSLKTLLDDILRDSLTGWQIHDRLDRIQSDDSSVDSIMWLLECFYAGWEKQIIPLDHTARDCIARCAAFLTTHSEVSISARTFFKEQKLWSNKFDLDEFLRVAIYGPWPFSSFDESNLCKMKLRGQDTRASATQQTKSEPDGENENTD